MRFVIALIVAAGCSKSDPGPPCEQVVDHMLEVTKQQLVGHGEAVTSQRTAMLKQCKDRNMSAATRTCLVAATNLTQIAECRAGTGGAKVTKPSSPATAPAAPGAAAPGSGSAR
jgi:hypothetical protein